MELKDFNNEYFDGLVNTFSSKTTPRGIKVYLQAIVLDAIAAGRSHQAKLDREAIEDVLVKSGHLCPISDKYFAALDEAAKGE
jgi:hypothetical protein